MLTYLWNWKMPISGIHSGRAELNYSLEESGQKMVFLWELWPKRYSSNSKTKPNDSTIAHTARRNWGAADKIASGTLKCRVNVWNTWLSQNGAFTDDWYNNEHLQVIVKHGQVWGCIFAKGGWEVSSGCIVPNAELHNFTIIHNTIPFGTPPGGHLIGPTLFLFCSGTVTPNRINVIKKHLQKESLKWSYGSCRAPISAS